MSDDPLELAERAAEKIAKRKPGVPHLLGHLYLLCAILQHASSMTEERWLRMCKEFWKRAQLRHRESKDVQ